MKALTPEFGDSTKRRIVNSKSELLVASHTKVNFTSSLTECRGGLSPPQIKSSKSSDPPVQARLSDVNYGQQTTIMPNTSEFKGLHAIKNGQQTVMDFQKLQKPTVNKTSDKKAIIIPKQSTTKWRVTVGVIWLFSLVAAFVFVVMNAAKSNEVDEHELVILKPTNYEICLLIGRNFRRLIVSSIYAVR